MFTEIQQRQIFLIRRAIKDYAGDLASLKHVIETLDGVSNFFDLPIVSNLKLLIFNLEEIYSVCLFEKNDISKDEKEKINQIFHEITSLFD